MIFNVLNGETVDTARTVSRAVLWKRCYFLILAWFSGENSFDFQHKFLQRRTLNFQVFLSGTTVEQL